MRSLLLPTLALLSCTPRSGPDPQSHACSFIKAELLAGRLRAADPHDQGRIVTAEFDDLCEWEPLGSTTHHEFGLNAAGQAVFARVCPGAPELHNHYSLTPEQLYDRCDFGRLQIVERAEYGLLLRTYPFAWTTYQWLIENGLSAEQARVIIRAELRSNFDWALRLPGLRLPATDAAREGGFGPTIQISATEVAFGDKLLDSGSEPLLAALEQEAYKSMSVAEAQGEAWEGGELFIAADRRTPFSTLATVAQTARQLEFSWLHVMVEPRLFDTKYLPLALARGERQALHVLVRADGYRVDSTDPAQVHELATTKDLAALALATCDAASSRGATLWADPTVEHERFTDAMAALSSCDELSLAAE